MGAGNRTSLLDALPRVELRGVRAGTAASGYDRCLGRGTLGARFELDLERHDATDGSRDKRRAAVDAGLCNFADRTMQVTVVEDNWGPDEVMMWGGSEVGWVALYGRL